MILNAAVSSLGKVKPSSGSVVDAGGWLSYRFDPAFLLLTVIPIDCQVVLVWQRIRHPNFTQLLDVIGEALSFPPTPPALVYLPFGY